ncbi:MAG: dTDP-glucose 4,6-dehydratase [Oscillatoriales cyanobacterium SM2_1_8]|nr:dTDP-glucose 4,6-dehydratase [Oscillatoriales cyanobacterium SM2_1_8]
MTPPLPTLLVTGGAGFIGANFVLQMRQRQQATVITLDKLTYAGNLQSLAPLKDDPHHRFVRGDIGNRELVAHLLEQFQPAAIVNFAAESHVDRSIVSPEPFLQTNVLGTGALLETACRYWQRLTGDRRDRFRFLHVSTDEVYGSLGPDDPPFTETTPFAPNSPYAASKAAADGLVRAFFHTYGLPVITTNCSNNYGPYQFPEKLIPLMILQALAGKPLPIYGDGQNVRDWLYVADHVAALAQVWQKGLPGETYNIGGRNELTNREVVHQICDLLDSRQPGPQSYRAQIAFVKDRPGHDRRYAIDCRKMERELGWQPQETFATGLAKTVDWYLTNPDWIAGVRSGEYQTWLARQYGEG